MRFLLLFLVAISASANMYSQAKVAIYAGVSKVLNAKALKQTDYSDEKFPPSLAFGCSYLRNNTKQISFIIKAGFLKKGFLRQNSFPDNSFYSKIKINYLYLTPQVSFNFFPEEISSLIITAGPYLALALSGKESGIWINFGGVRNLNQKIAFNNSIQSNTELVQISRYDFGINSSLVYQIKKFGLMLNWQGGIKNIVTFIPFFQFKKSYRNNTLELSAFYQIELRKDKIKTASNKCPIL